jgi:hypothetical protein
MKVLLKTVSILTPTVVLSACGKFSFRRKAACDDLSSEDAALLEDLETIELLDSRGNADPNKICPCFKHEIEVFDSRTYFYFICS